MLDLFCIIAPGAVTAVPSWKRPLGTDVNLYWGRMPANLLLIAGIPWPKVAGYILSKKEQKLSELYRQIEFIPLRKGMRKDDLAVRNKLVKNIIY